MMVAQTSWRLHACASQAAATHAQLHFCWPPQAPLCATRHVNFHACFIVVSVHTWQVTTLIGYGSPNKAGTHDVHGAALGDPETEETRNNLGWKYPPFELPDSVKETMSRVEEVR